MNTKDMKSLEFELNNLYQKVRIYSQKNDYIYTKIYGAWIKEYNQLLDKYNTFTKLHISHLSYASHDLSSTQKTVRAETVEWFLNTVKNLIEKVKSEINEEREKMTEEEIGNVVDQAAQEMDVQLSDEDRQEIVDLMDKIKGLDIDVDSLKEQAKDLYDKIDDLGLKLDWNQEKVQGFFSKIIEFFKNLFS